MTEQFDKFVEFILEKVQTMEELNRESPPYGFWISPSGEYTVVRQRQHDSVADAIISKNPSLIKKFMSDPISPANFLSKEKYIRVVFAHYTNMLLGDCFYYIQNEEGAWIPVRFEPTSGSLKTFKDLASFYGVRSKMVNR